MIFIVTTLLGGLAIMAVANASLLRQRRALRESEEQFRLWADQAPVLIYGPLGRTRHSTILMASACS
jgi:hypothetical protein